MEANKNVAAYRRRIKRIHLPVTMIPRFLLHSPVYYALTDASVSSNRQTAVLVYRVLLASNVVAVVDLGAVRGGCGVV
jgi:hypothetical protein